MRLFSAQRKIFYSKGFSIIEILVVFTLISLLAGLGVVSFLNYSRSQQVSQAVINTRSFVQQAKFNALSSVKPQVDYSGVEVDCGSESLSSYSLTNTSTSLSILLNCTNTDPIEISRYTLPSELSYNQVTSDCDTIDFELVNANPSGLPCSLVIEGYDYTVRIDIDELANTSFTYL